MALYSIRSKMNDTLIDIVSAPTDDMAISQFVDRHGGDPSQMMARLARKSEVNMTRSRYRSIFSFSGSEDHLRDNVIRVREMIQRRALINS